MVSPVCSSVQLHGTCRPWECICKGGRLCWGASLQARSMLPCLTKLCLPACAEVVECGCPAGRGGQQHAWHKQQLLGCCAPRQLGPAGLMDIHTCALQTQASPDCCAGVNCFFGALAFTLPSTTFAQNNGVIVLTRCGSRSAGVACGIWLLLFGILAKVSMQAWHCCLPDAAMQLAELPGFCSPA